MKNITRKLNILFAVAIFVLPIFAHADYGYDYGTTDYYTDGYGTTDYYTNGYGTTDYYTLTNSGTPSSYPTQPIYLGPEPYISQMPQITYYNEGGGYWEPGYSYDGYDGYDYQPTYFSGCTSNCGYSSRGTVVIRDRIIRDNDSYNYSDYDYDYNYNNNNDLEVVCRVSDTYVDEGDKVTFTAEVDGGDSPYKYSWRGDASGNDRKITKTFRNSGTYEVSVRVTDDDGNTATDECVVRVGDDDNGSYSTSIFDYPYNNGDYASVDSVFLNQVPYTGPADTVKGIGFVALVLAWSFAIAYAIRKKMNRNETVKRIEEFKNLNRETQTIN